MLKKDKNGKIVLDPRTKKPISVGQVPVMVEVEEPVLREVIKTTDESLYCMYSTTKPRCAAFNGILKTDSQVNMICDALPATPSCLESTYAGLCSHSLEGEPCGTKATTRDVMACCDENANKPGKCHVGRRRRLGASW